MGRQEIPKIGKLAGGYGKDKENEPYQATRIGARGRCHIAVRVNQAGLAALFCRSRGRDRPSRICSAGGLGAAAFGRQLERRSQTVSVASLAALARTRAYRKPPLAQYGSRGAHVTHVTQPLCASC